MQTFSEIYVLDLHGNSKKKEETPDGGKDDNVFDIQQGVAILLAVKEKTGSGRGKNPCLCPARCLVGTARIQRRRPPHRRQVSLAMAQQRGNNAVEGVERGCTLLPVRAAGRQLAARSTSKVGKS